MDQQHTNKTVQQYAVTFIYSHECPATYICDSYEEATMMLSDNFDFMILEYNSLRRGSIIRYINAEKTCAEIEFQDSISGIVETTQIYVSPIHL